jgi:hypothetical protein
LLAWPVGTLSEDDFIAAHDISAARGPSPRAAITEPEKRRLASSDRVLAQLPALFILPPSPSPAKGAEGARPAAAEALKYLRENESALTYDQATGTLRAGTTRNANTIRPATYPHDRQPLTTEFARDGRA